MYLPSSTEGRVAMKWSTRSMSASGSTISSGDDETMTIIRPADRWSCINSRASPKMIGEITSSRTSVTTRRTRA